MAEDPGERGTLVVRGKAVGRIAELAALGVPGVLRCRPSGLSAFTGRGLPRAMVDMATGHPNVRVDVALLWPSPIAALCERVSEHIVAELDRLTGLTPSRVDVSVVELLASCSKGDQP